jgi:hypothetical protein
MPKILLAMVLFVTAGEFSRHRVSELFRHTDVLAAMCEAEVLQRDLLSQQIAQQRRGISPASAWHCPASHPIKGNFTTYNGERCIFHSPGGQFYDKTKPEMRYATPADASADGCRTSLR